MGDGKNFGKLKIEVSGSEKLVYSPRPFFRINVWNVYLMRFTVKEGRLIIPIHLSDCGFRVRIQSIDSLGAWELIECNEEFPILASMKRNQEAPIN